jgi:hypothetical protein
MNATFYNNTLCHVGLKYIIQCRSSIVRILRYDSCRHGFSKVILILYFRGDAYIHYTNLVRGTMDFKDLYPDIDCFIRKPVEIHNLVKNSKITEIATKRPLR